MRPQARLWGSNPDHSKTRAYFAFSPNHQPQHPENKSVFLIVGWSWEKVRASRGAGVPDGRCALSHRARSTVLLISICVLAAVWKPPGQEASALSSVPKTVAQGCGYVLVISPLFFLLLLLWKKGGPRGDQKGGQSWLTEPLLFAI